MLWLLSGVRREQRAMACRAVARSEAARPAFASLCDAPARHPSPAFMSEGWWT
jgi:hypothetical protein